MTGTNTLAEHDGSTALLALIQRAATDNDFSIEKLEKLLDVKERWDAEEARKAYVAALAAFKRNPPALVKSQTVDFSTNKGRTKYNYASLGQVASAVASALSEHGLSHSWAVSQEGGGVAVTCTLTHERGHSESVSITGPEDDTGNKNGIQQIGSAITYLERYTLMAITGLAAHDQDDDGIASGERGNARPTNPTGHDQAPSSRPQPKGRQRQDVCLEHNRPFAPHPDRSGALVHPVNGGHWCYKEEINTPGPIGDTDEGAAEAETTPEQPDVEDPQ